jgi:hypothetical protein
MLAERILGKLRAKVTHHSIAANFGDHAGGSDTQADAIAIDYRRLRKWKWDHRQAVDQNMIGLVDQCFDCKAHGFMARTQNVDSIDLDRIDNANSPSQFGISDQFAIDLLAQFRRKLFGIIQATMTESFGQNHRSRHDGAR